MREKNQSWNFGVAAARLTAILEVSTSNPVPTLKSFSIYVDSYFLKF